MTTCVRCGIDLTKPPHVKLCWHGTPGAYLTGEKGDLCDPCHEVWKAERKMSSAPLCETCGEPAAVRSSIDPTHYCNRHRTVPGTMGLHHSHEL